MDVGAVGAHAGGTVDSSGGGGVGGVGGVVGGSGNNKDAAPASLQLEHQFSLIQDQSIKRTSGWADVVYHSITAMIGAGVLGLPATFAHLGYAGGALFLAFSLWVSWYTYVLLVQMHEVPDLAGKGGVRRLDRYDQLAAYVLGERRGKLVLLPFQLAVLVGIAVTYTVVGGDSLAAFAAALSFTRFGKWFWYLVFGGLQLVLSLLPSFDDLRWVSALGALMSALYCGIAVGTSASVMPDANVSYNPMAVERSPVERLFGVFNALSAVFFAFGGHNVSLEVQATIAVDQYGDGRSGAPVSSVPGMLKGVLITFVITGLCYFSVAILGFHAFGVAVPDNVLAAFAHDAGRAGSAAHILVTAANLMVVAHVAAAYQVYTQPVYNLVEERLGRARVRGVPPPPGLATMLRLVYVCAITLVALLVPFFGSLMGLVGSVGITPTTFTLPPLFWIMLTKPPRWSRAWLVNWGMVWSTALIGLLGAAGSVYSIVLNWSTFKLFAG